MTVERVAGLVEVDVVRKHDRQLIARYGDGTARTAVNDGNRGAPVALARHAPVAEAVLDGAFAPSCRLGTPDDLRSRLLGFHPIQEIRVYRDSGRIFGLI